MMAERVLMKGNEAIAEAAIRAGCRHYFGYPITPQTEIAAYMAKKMPKIGGVFLQAESEIASINMVYGAAAAGMRVMTSSSSPGISLKTEGLSYIAGSDVPAFVVNVQRGGPGLGGIQPSQSDYFQATKGGGHGDYRMIVLAPASVQEMASLTIKGFNLADKYLMTAMILADGTIGQMMEPISFEDAQVEEYEKPWALTGTNCARKHNVVNSLYLQPDELEKKNFQRYERYKLVEENEDLKQNLSVAAHLIHGSSDGRFQITYCAGKLTEEEVRGAAFNYMPYEQAVAKYDPAKLTDGFNAVDGEEIFYISNPALGLWVCDD